MTIAELPLFIRQAAQVWTESEHDEFVSHIAANLEGGKIVPETGGVRKIRWTRSGSGKRGGTRVIYFYHDPTVP